MWASPFISAWLWNPVRPHLCRLIESLLWRRVCCRLTTFQACCAVSCCWHLSLSSPSITELWKHWPSVLYMAHIHKLPFPARSKLFPLDVIHSFGPWRKAIIIVKWDFLNSSYQVKNSPATWLSPGGGWGRAFLHLNIMVFLHSPGITGTLEFSFELGSSMWGWNFGLSLAGESIGR